MGDVSELPSELLFNLGKRTPQLVRRRAPAPLPFSCITLRLKGNDAAPVQSSPLKKGSFTIGKQERKAGHKNASIRGDACMEVGFPFCSITASNTSNPTTTPDKWSGSELLQGILLRLLPGLKHELDYLAWEELQVGQQLPPGTAAEENEAKTRRRDKRRKAGEIGEGTKQFRVAAGEEQLWEVFAEFCGRDGYISSSELRAALLKLGLPCTPEYLRLLMNELDVDHDSKVDWPDFRAFFSMRSRGIEKAFRAFDRDGDGVITMDELEQALTSAGIPADEETIRRMISRMDVNLSKTISLQEFTRFATFLPVHMGESIADPSLFAAWWRTTSMAPSVTDSTLIPQSGVGTQQRVGYLQANASPFNLQNFFTVFDIIVRTSLAATLLVVLAGFNEQGFD
mmetsp:Transcript_1431/g.3449  ORF Transcript_1431/g.3449 Transcript_1431/m.3449 type:complete len:398 (+) Transcript_1431:469-1662(+)